MCILELVKYEFYYDYSKSKYDAKSKLLITDTNNV